jgi:alcohol dehydrogenase
MIGVHLEGGTVTVRDVPRPRRRPGFALLKLRLAGICNTDLELLRGYYGFAGRPGHEFVADVFEADDKRWIGKRVVGEINLACGRCEWCARGLGRHCPARTVLGIVKHPGAFADYLTLPEMNLREVPRGLRDEEAVFTEPVAAACEILEQCRIPKSAAVAVLGDGKLGLLIAQTLAAHGADVSLYGHHPERARRAGVARGRAGKRFAWVIEATGSEVGLAQAIEMCVPRGTVICKSTVAARVAIDMAQVIVPEITLVGSRCGRFEPALKLLAAGKVRTDWMIAARVPLREAPRAFELAATRGTLKVLLEP